MATIEKLKSGRYRIIKMYKGKFYRTILDRKPSKAEAEKIMWSLIEEQPEKGPYEEFQSVAENYIKSKDAVLSPSTINNYYSVLRNIPESFKICPISAISTQDIQICVNTYAKAHSAKSVRNMSGFISAVMKSVRPNFSSNVTLPQKVPKDFYVPEDSDIKKILDYAAGTRYEVPLWLATYGFRRSEIGALLTSDLSKDNIITVNKAKVLDKNRQWVIKTTKTAQSIRKMKVSQEVADLIRAMPDGPIYSGSLGQLNEYLQATQKKLGIPKFNLHLMRHYFASTAREIMPDSYVEKLGGWKPGSQIMKKVYDYQKDKQAQEAQEALIERFKKLS
jgi:integrase